MSTINDRFLKRYRQSFGRKSISMTPMVEEKLERDMKIIIEFLTQNDVPPWFRGGNRFQIDAGEKLFGAIRDDSEQRTTHRVRQCLVTLGISPMPPDEDLKTLMQMSRGNDLAFLWFLMEMHYKTPGQVYCVNEQIILSLISHLDMVTTLRELDRVLPPGHPSKKNIEKQKKVKEVRDKQRRRRVKQEKLRKVKYESPYFEPLPTLRPYGKKLNVDMPNFYVQFSEYKDYLNPNFVVLNESNRWFAKYKLHQVERDDDHVSNVFGSFMRDAVAKITNGILDGKLKDIFEEMERIRDGDEKNEKVALCDRHMEQRIMKELAKAKKIVELRDRCLRYMDTEGYKKKKRLQRIQKQLEKDVNYYRKTLREEGQLEQQTDVHMLGKESFDKCGIRDPEGECSYVGPKTLLICENRCDIKKVRRDSSEVEKCRKAQGKSRSDADLEAVAEKIDKRLLTERTPYQPDSVLICTRNNDIRQMKRVLTDIDSCPDHEMLPPSDGLHSNKILSENTHKNTEAKSNIVLQKEIINRYSREISTTQKKEKSMASIVFKNKSNGENLSNIENVDPNRQIQKSFEKTRKQESTFSPQIQFYENINIAQYNESELESELKRKKTNHKTRNIDLERSKIKGNRLAGGTELRKGSVYNMENKRNTQHQRLSSGEMRKDENPVTINQKNEMPSNESKFDREKVSKRDSTSEQRKTPRTNQPIYEKQPYRSFVESLSNFKTLSPNRQSRQSTPIYERISEKLSLAELVSAWNIKRASKPSVEERVSLPNDYDTLFGEEDPIVESGKSRRQRKEKSEKSIILNERQSEISRKSRVSRKKSMRGKRLTENEMKENEWNANEKDIITMNSECLNESAKKKPSITDATKRFRKILGEITNEPATRQISPRFHIKQKPQPSSKSSEIFFKAPAEHKPYEFDYRKIFEYKHVGDKQKMKYKQVLLDALDCDEKVVAKLLDNTPDTVDAANKCGMKMWKDGLAMQRGKEMESKQSDKPAISDKYILPNVLKQDFYDCDDRDLMDRMLNEALKLMSKNPKFVLASLVDAYKLPVLREWIYQRYGKSYTRRDCIKSYGLSHKIFRILEKVALNVPLPKGNELGTNKNLNYDCLEYVVRKANRIKHQFRKKLNSAIMEQGRIFWFAMQPYMCSHGPSRNQYFSYMPARVRDINHFRPWKPTEFRNVKKIWERTIMKTGNARILFT